MQGNGSVGNNSAGNNLAGNNYLAGNDHGVSHYQIVYNSVLLAMDREQVVDEFARLFRIPVDKADAILDRPKTVLRTRLDATTADLYREKLVAIGIDVDVVDVSRPKPSIVRAVDAVAIERPDAPSALVMALEPIDEAPGVDGETRAGYHGNRHVALDFFGGAAEYFGIWIGNVLLTLLTGGLYLPWAMVRNRQYFHANTRLLDVPFQYLATPLQTAAGRLALLAAWLGLCVLPWQLPPVAAASVVSLLLLVFPAVMVSVLRSRITAWRDVPLVFARDVRGAYAILLLPLALLGVVLVLPLLHGIAGAGGSVKAAAFLSPVGSAAGLALVLGFPYWHWSVENFLVNCHRFGGERFHFAARPYQYYLLYFIKLPLVMAVIGILQGVSMMLFASASVVHQWQKLQGLVQQPPAEAWAFLQQGMGGNAVVMLLLVTLVWLCGACWLVAYLKVNLCKLRYNGVALGKSTVLCSMRTLPLLQLYMTNTLAILFSLGLLVPWARMRTLHYRLTAMEVFVSYEMDDIVGNARRLMVTENPSGNVGPG